MAAVAIGGIFRGCDGEDTLQVGYLLEKIAKRICDPSAHFWDSGA